MSEPIFSSDPRSARRSRRWLRTIAAAAILACAASAQAQEGHPLKGSWLGNWEDNSVHGEAVLLVLDWDGESITGIINPGTDNIEIEEATLDPEGWIVRIEADGVDASGNTLRYRIEGEIMNLELPSRSIVGSWRTERGGGTFEVSRQ